MLPVSKCDYKHLRAVIWNELYNVSSRMLSSYYAYAVQPYDKKLSHFVKYDTMLNYSPL